jgi:uncharacterized RDD family membrane protein YckC
MINQEIINYIKTQLEKGKNKEEIIASLKNNNWPETEIQEAFETISNSNTDSIIPSNQNETTVAHAGFWIRFLAYFIDGIIVIVSYNIIIFLIVFFGTIFFGLRLGNDFSVLENSGLFSSFYILLFAIYILMYIICFPVLTYKYGATLGKRICGLKVITQDNQKMTFKRALLREVVGRIISSIILYIGFIMTAFTKRKESLHDKIAKTFVVYKDPSKKITKGSIVAIIMGGILMFIIVGLIISSIILASLNSAKLKSEEVSQDSQTELDFNNLDKQEIISMIASDLKSNNNFPIIINELVHITDVTQEGDSIRYHYRLFAEDAGFDEAQVKNEIKNEVCLDSDIKNFFEADIGIEYAYSFDNDKSFLIKLNKSDCL